MRILLTTIVAVAVLLGAWLMWPEIGRSWLAAIVAGRCDKPDVPPECHPPTWHVQRLR